MGGHNVFTEAIRAVLRPFGYLVFVVALAALSLSAWVLGEKHELGFFAGRLSQTISRYPEVTRPGVWMAWCVWAALLVLAVSPVSPTHWDEVAVGAIALGVLWRRTLVARRAGR